MKICLVINGFHNGGIERVLENYFSHMNLEEMELHVISHLEPNETIEKRFKEMGFEIHHFSYFHARKITPKNMKEYDDFFKRNKFDIVHNNVANNILPLLYAKKYGVPVRILHSHNDYSAAFENKNKLIKTIYGFVIKRNVDLATHYFACGIRAAKSVFPEEVMDKVQIINNAFNTTKFAFNRDSRIRIRSELGLEDAIIVGHVGRYEDDQKNQDFVVDLFKEYQDKHTNAHLLMIGEGKERLRIEKRCTELGLKATFTGAVDNIQDYYSAIDIFVFPSKYEGLSVTTLEAQCADLPGAIAEGLSPEMNVLNEYTVLPLNAGAKVWADSLKKKERRRDRSQDLANAGYEISIEASRLRSMYFEFMEKERR